MSYITQDQWIDTIRREYLHSFIKRGGAAVKFAVPMEDRPSPIAKSCT